MYFQNLKSEFTFSEKNYFFFHIYTNLNMLTKQEFHHLSVSQMCAAHKRADSQSFQEARFEYDP